MKSSLMNDKSKDEMDFLSDKISLDVQVDVLHEIMKKVISEKTIRARIVKYKLNKYIHSDDIYKKIYAINKIISDGKGIDIIPNEKNIEEAIENTNQCLADAVAKKYVENSIEKEVEQAVMEKQEKYIDEVRLGII
ncbi:MAG: ATP-dependent protease, Lon family, partial [Clostridiaceae bacterium]